MMYMKEYIDFDDYDIEEKDAVINSPLTDKEFVKFLKDNHIHDKFVYNYQRSIDKKKRNRYPYIEISDYCDMTNDLDYILSSFSWVDSHEGIGFWSGYNDKWKEFYLENLLK